MFQFLISNMPTTRKITRSGQILVGEFGRGCGYHCHPYSRIWIPTFRFQCLTYIVRFDNHFCAHLNYLHMISLVITCCQLSKCSGHTHRLWILILNLGLNIVHIVIDSLSRINVNLLYCSLVRDQYTIHPPYLN